MFTNHPHAEDPHAIVVGDDDLKEAGGFAHRDSPRIGRIVKLYNFVWDSFSHAFLFTHTHSGYFRVKEHDRADVFVGKRFYDRTEHPDHRVTRLSFSDIYQRNFGSGVTGYENITDVGLSIVVPNTSTFVEFYSNIFKSEIFNISDATYRYQCFINCQHL